MKSFIECKCNLKTKKVYFYKIDCSDDYLGAGAAIKYFNALISNLDAILFNLYTYESLKKHIETASKDIKEASQNVITAMSKKAEILNQFLSEHSKEEINKIKAIKYTPEMELKVYKNKNML